MSSSEDEWMLLVVSVPSCRVDIAARHSLHQDRCCRYPQMSIRAVCGIRGHSLITSHLREGAGGSVQCDTL